MGGFILVLDTHIWVWSQAEPNRIPSGLRRELTELRDSIAISVISIWETLMLIERGRIAVEGDAEDAVRGWIDANDTRVLPLDEETAFLARSLPFVHGDPADRFIAATAVRHGCPLATLDTHLRGLPFLDVRPIA